MATNKVELIETKVRQEAYTSDDKWWDGKAYPISVYHYIYSGNDKAYITIINSEKSYDDIKVELENSGFSCK